MVQEIKQWLIQMQSDLHRPDLKEVAVRAIQSRIANTDVRMLDLQERFRQVAHVRTGVQACMPRLQS